jgi:hypothetical protein
MLESLIAAMAGAAAVAVPVVSWLMRVESRLTRLETTIAMSLQAHKL